MNHEPTRLIANSMARTYHEWWRVGQFDEWWHWMAVVFAVALIGGFTIWLYRKDSRELRGPTAWSLVALRVFVILCLVAFFLQLQRRTERRVVKTSRAVILVDTSQSMGLPASSPPADAAAGSATLENITGSRLARVKEEFTNGTLLDELRQNHDVRIYRFDEGTRPVELASLSKTPLASLAEGESEEIRPLAPPESANQWARSLVLLAGITLALHFGLAVRSSHELASSWALLIAVLTLMGGTVSMAYFDLRSFSPALESASQNTDTADEAARGEEPPSPNSANQWLDELTPSGKETRLADALKFLIDQEKGGPVAGISVWTDGNHNAGPDCLEVADAAGEAGVAIFPVGFGSTGQLKNLRLVDLAVPSRVYPGDAFRITAYVQSHGLRGESAELQLHRRVMGVADANPDDKDESGQPPSDSPTHVDTRQIPRLDEDGQVQAILFELTPDEIGQFEYTLTVTTPAAEDEHDNSLSSSVQVVDRQNRVLLVAGGPTREYRFVRNLCFRDAMIATDVFLQTRLSGTAQEADNLLDEFPSSTDELFEYDCILAFDPDWEQFSATQVEMLDRWLSEQAGGLITVAGPVFTPNWSSRRSAVKSLETVKSFYPVSFFGHAAARVARRSYASNTPMTLDFGDHLNSSRFLWIGESIVASAESWSGFEGVYGYQPVRGPKPGATVYATLASDHSSPGDPAKPFLAGHFYGAGRVLFLASGEMWRLRSTGGPEFDRFYTNLIRYVSEGRLLRDSSHGLLLVEKDRCVLGETVTVRAVLSDRQHRPLQNDDVLADLISPDGTRGRLRMEKLAGDPRQGTYVGEFTAMLPGNHRIELLVPDSDASDLLVGQVRARVPDLEIQTPQRNDALLNEVARRTDGSYFVGVDGALNGPTSLAEKLIPQDQATYLPGSPDRNFQQRLMAWYLMLLSGALSLEWLVRRLNQLA